MSEAGRAGGADGQEALEAEDAVVRLITPLAGLALLALTTGRVLAPALESVGVGMGALVGGLQRLGAISSQAFGLAAMMIAIVTVLAASRSRLPMPLRIAAIALGGFAVLPTVWALQEPVSDLAASLVGASAALLALATVPVLLRAPFARGPGAVIGLVALGGLLRLGAVGAAVAAGAAGSMKGAPLATTARVAATAALLCDAAAIAVTIAWTTRSGRAKDRNRLTSPGTLVIFALALFLTREALAGQVDARGIELLCWRAAVRLMSRPEASLPLALRIFIAFLAPLVAATALFARGGVAPLGAAVALALCAHGAVEMPPCALMLVIAALGAALTARDGRLLWASLDPVKPAAAGPGAAGAKSPTDPAPRAP